VTSVKKINRAIFSECENYRYWLERPVQTGDGNQTPCVFVMLNPSTADAEKLDPTCTRCFNYAAGWNCGRLVVVNCFAWRSTDPKGLLQAAAPIGVETDKYIDMAARYAFGSGGIVVCAWGGHATLNNRAQYVYAILCDAASDTPGAKLTALKVNADGSPSHPLYLKASLKPLKFSL